MAQQLITRVPTPAAHKANNSTAVTAVFIIALVFFFAPWAAAAIFGFSRPGEGFTFGPLVEAFENPRAWRALQDTLLLAVATTVVMLILLVPTIVYLNLNSPKLAKAAETLSVLPIVIPAVALVSGVSEFYRAVAPGFLISLWSLVPLYVIIAMPLCYRAIDAGVKALDLRTLFSASSSLGASNLQTLIRVVIPNLRVSMLSASLLCIALVLAEFAIASLLLHYTFPVFIVEVSRNNPRGIAALSFITILLTWALLSIISATSKADKTKNQKGD